MSMIPPLGGETLEPPMITLGEIVVTSNMINTPAGPIKLSGAQWTVTDMSRHERVMPTHAVVLAIIFFIFCLLGLLFLLMKEDRYSGNVTVSVSNDGKYFQTTIPVHGPGVFPWAQYEVNRARQMSMF